MILDLPSTTTSQVNSKLVHLRQVGGAVTLGRVLTLVIVTDDGAKTEEAIEAANDASREHPCRVIVVARGAKRAAARLDAQIRVGGDAGASEVVVLRLYGPLADEGASCVIPLLLPDTPVVAWWPFEAPDVPAKDPIGQLANRRITDSANDRNPSRAIDHRKNTYVDGDTDLAWTRLTTWRAMLAAALDLPPYDRISGAEVAGEADSPSADLLAAWLAVRLKIPVTRYRSTAGPGIVRVALQRRSGDIELVRPDGKLGTLTQTGQPDRKVALQRKSVRDCLSEELRRLDADEIYAETLRGLPKVVIGRSGSRKSAGAGAAGGTKAAAKTGGARRGAAAKPAGTKAAGTKAAGTKAAGTKAAGTKAAPKAAGTKAATKAAGTKAAAPKTAAPKTAAKAKPAARAGSGGAGSNGAKAGAKPAGGKANGVAAEAAASGSTTSGSAGTGAGS